MLNKVVSGGQTGVDRTGLDAAFEAGIPIGGWCPKGRLAEYGTVPDKYPLMEMKSSNHTSRTEQNVIDSNGTLILNKGNLSGGTKRTAEFATNHDKPCMVVQLDRQPDIEPVLMWLTTKQIRILNVAGPSESKLPSGIYVPASAFLSELFQRFR